MGPIDYSGAFGDQAPAQAFSQWFNVGAGVRERQLAMDEKQRQADAAQAMREDLTALSADPTPHRVAAMSLKYPQLSEQFKRSFDMLKPEQQQAKLSQAIPVYAAVQSGRMDVAARTLRDTAQALENSNQSDEAARTRAMADLVEQHPETAKLTTGMLLSSIMGPDKFADTFGKLGAEARASEQAPAELRLKNAEATIKEAAAAVAPETQRQALQKGVWDNANTRSQIEERAARLGLDRDKLTSEVQLKLTELQQKSGQLPDDARKLVNDSAIAASVGEQQMGQYNRLASQLDAQGRAGKGYISNVGEWLASATGNQDALTGIRQEYTRLMAQGVMKLLPPGPASDRDIALAREGFPKANADAAYLASFMRGMAKLSAYDAVLNNAKSEWVGAVQHLGKSPRDIEIDGVKVPAGTTFAEFSRQFMQRKADSMANASALQTRGYMKWATDQPGMATGGGGGY